MDLHDYLRILRRNWVLIVAVTLTGLLVGGTASALVKPSYTAEAELFVSIQGSGSVTELQQGNTFSQARVQSYVKTVGTPAVLQPVIDSLGLKLTSDELASRVKAGTDLNTVLINISAVDASPVQAAAIAQGVSNSLINVVDTLEKPKTGGTSPVSLSVIKPAVAPTTPSAPNTRMNLILGFVVGLIAGIGLAVSRTLLDTRIRGEADLKQSTDLPLLGGVAFETSASEKPLITQIHHQSTRAEAFRQMRTNLQFANVSGRTNSIMVTSSVPGEGKSTTSANLAISMSQAGLRVCLVDADLRRPSVSEYFGIDRNAGLTTALIGQADLEDLLQPWGEDSLYILTSGQIPPNPSELLGSAEMERLVRRLESAFDVVVIDAPPLLPVTDPAVLSQHVGGVVVVVGAQRVKHPELTRSLKALELVDAHVLGLVMNRLPAKGPDSYAYNYYAYSSEQSAQTSRTRTGKGSSTRKRLPQASMGPSENVQKDRAASPSDEIREPSHFLRDRVEAEYRP